LVKPTPARDGEVDTAGSIFAKSAKSLMFSCSIVLVFSVWMLIGTSCMFSDRFWAVTSTSSISWESAGRA
jgi:hypothetical protein